jgi:hypothetical protein
MYAPGALGMEADVALFEDRLEVDGHRLAVAPTDGDPGIGRDEGVLRALRDH